MIAIVMRRENLGIWRKEHWGLNEMAAFRPRKEAKGGQNWQQLDLRLSVLRMWENQSLSLRSPSLGCFVTAGIQIQKVHRSEQQMLVTSQLYLVLDILIYPEQVSESQEPLCRVGEMAQ